MPNSGKYFIPKKWAYKARLGYKKQREVQYLWVYCTDVTHYVLQSLSAVHITAWKEDLSSRNHFLLCSAMYLFYYT